MKKVLFIAGIRSWCSRYVGDHDGCDHHRDHCGRDRWCGRLERQQGADDNHDADDRHELSIHICPAFGWSSCEATKRPAKPVGRFRICHLEVA